MGPARGRGAVNEGIAGGLIIVIRQPHHRGFSASHWHPGTSVAKDSRRLDGAKPLLVVIAIQVSVHRPIRTLPRPVVAAAEEHLDAELVQQQRL